jgi:anti-sigma factor (TIGR02949 family)
MTCDELLRRLTDFGDGALPESLCEELRQHMTECGPCAELQADLAALARLCRQCPPPRLPEDVRRRLEERLGSGGSPSAGGRVGPREGSG